MSDAAVKHLQPEEIRYLALEGGGGKGFAYLGAIQVLEESLGQKAPVMTHIEGVAGTSAGAITALMLSLGMTAKDIEHELATNDFNTFFDPVRDANNHRLVPAVQAKDEAERGRLLRYRKRTNDECEKRMLAGDVLGLGSLLMCLRTQGSVLASLFGYDAFLFALAGKLSPLGELRKEIASLATLDVIPTKYRAGLAPVAELIRGLPEYLAYFHRDMGFFSGHAAREYFDGLLSKRIELALGKGRWKDLPVPFILHHELVRAQVFKRDLLVCGANLSTGKTELFSFKHTPSFPVADAVRISMGLPGVYKPYVIDERLNGWPPCGTYVDGGLWNNLPFREIGTLLKPERAPQKSCSAAMSPPPESTRPVTSLNEATESRTTLALRLEIEAPEHVRTGGDLVAKVLATVLSAGESQVIADLEPFTLSLDTTGLDLFNFAPNDAVKKAVLPRSRRATYHYFGLEPPPEDKDDMDDRRIKELKSRTICR